MRLSADLVCWSLVLVEAPAARTGTQSLQDSTRLAIVPDSFQRQTDSSCLSGTGGLVCCEREAPEAGTARILQCFELIGTRNAERYTLIFLLSSKAKKDDFFQSLD